MHLEDEPAPEPVGRLDGDAAIEATRPEQRPSSTSGRLVAPITMTPADESNPSISVRIWLSVCSRSSWPPRPPNAALRERPIASSSSMKTIAGAACFACWKRSRTREAPTPTIISMNSEADIEKNGTPASPATARARSVFPVPGGPLSSTPRGMRPRVAGTSPGSEEVDDLGELLLRLVDPGHVGEADGFVPVAVVEACPRLAERAQPGRRRRRAPGGRSRTSARGEAASGRSRRAGSATRDTRVERVRVDDDALRLEQAREGVGVGERGDLGAELRRLRAAGPGRIARRLKSPWTAAPVDVIVRTLPARTWARKKGL